MGESEPSERYRISRDLESADREIRKRRLRDEGSREGDFRGEESAHDEFGSEEEEALLENVIRFQNARESTHAKLLLEDGVELPAPDSFRDDEDVERKLWEVINTLACRRVYLHHTNHLSDRQLYELLWRQHLNEMTKDLAECPGSACHIDFLEECSDAERERFLVYFADEVEWEYRGHSLSDGRTARRFGPPYDRDRHLPKRDW